MRHFLFSFASCLFTSLLLSQVSSIQIQSATVISTLSLHQWKPVEIRRVIDGDTVVLSSGVHLRLIGVDTPERGEPFYKEARALLVQLLKMGKEVWVEFDRRKYDRYGRLLGYLFVKMGQKALFVNGQMVFAGYAYVYPYPPNLKYWSDLTYLQRLARKGKKGLWRRKAPKGESYYIGSRYRFHRPSCPNGKRLKRARKIFLSRGEALDRGLSPARCCHP